MTLGVRAIVENSDGQVLLVRHTYVSGLDLPGGGVEKDEPALTALRRELLEEAGVALNGTAVLLGIYSNQPNFRNDHVLVYHIAADAWKQVTPTQKNEIHESLWIDPIRPPKDITPGNKQRLQEFYKNLEPCLYW